MGKKEIIEDLSILTGSAAEGLANAQLEESMNKELLEEKKKLKRTKLTEDFKKVDKSFENIDTITYELRKLVESNKDNAILQEYVKLQEKILTEQKKIDESKAVIYNDMVEADLFDVIEGKYAKTSATKPYVKNEFDKDRFITDFGENIYTKYLSQKEVKGNVKFLLLKK